MPKRRYNAINWVIDAIIDNFSKIFRETAQNRDGIHTDVSKAFDHIGHLKLIPKLSFFGLAGCNAL